MTSSDSIPPSFSASYTESRLIDGLRAREDAAWQRLVGLYAPLVFGWALRRVPGPADAADVVQEVFVVVVRRIGEFRKDRPTDTFRGWLWGITNNVLLNARRLRMKQASARGGSDHAQSLQQISAGAEEGSSLDGYGDLCRRALGLIQAEFEAPTWQAFWLVVVDGKSPTEAAQQLQLTPNAVYVAKFRVLRRLREALGEA